MVYVHCTYMTERGLCVWKNVDFVYRQNACIQRHMCIHPCTYSTCCENKRFTQTPPHNSAMMSMHSFLSLKPDASGKSDSGAHSKRRRIAEGVQRAKNRLTHNEAGGSQHGTQTEAESEGEEDDDDRAKQLESKLRDDSQAVLHTRRLTDEDAADLDDVAVAMAEEADDGGLDSDDRGWGEYDRLVYYRVR